MTEYEAYLFDWDGTLARTVELWLEEIYKEYEVHGLTITRAENARHFGNLKAPILYGLPPENISLFQEAVNQRMKQQLPNAALYEHAVEMLHQLKAQGKKIALGYGIGQAWARGSL
jgi:pyrophosphatase PpaX